jgi:UDP-N-acetylglucosamine:LPS N-acetylglucosamine transferase
MHQLVDRPPPRPAGSGRDVGTGHVQGPAGPERQQIVLISASVGAGHDGAARELAARLEADGFEVTRHDFLDLLPAGLGRILRAGYETQLRVVPGSWGWLLRTLERHAALSASVSTLAAFVAGRRVRAAVGSGAAAVVSTYPFASQVLGRLRRTGRVGAPVVTFLTDMSVHRLWVADGVDAHLALHGVPAEQAARLAATGVRVCGPAVSPTFHPARSPRQRCADRARFGLPEQAPLALVVAGSWGVGDIERTVADIARCGVVIPVVACGRNVALRHRLTSGGVAIAVGWTDEMASLVRSCDVVVQNAGGLSSLEALASGVPVVTYRSLAGHGETNARALEEAGWAVWIRTPADLAAGLKSALTGELPKPVPMPDDPAVAIAELVRMAPAGTVSCVEALTEVVV